MLKYLSVGESQLLCDIAWAFPRLSSHYCNYGTFIGLCPYIPSEICIHKDTLWQTSEHIIIWMLSTEVI
jgi:hypothetical protein